MTSVGQTGCDIQGDIQKVKKMKSEDLDLYFNYSTYRYVITSMQAHLLNLNLSPFGSVIFLQLVYVVCVWLVFSCLFFSRCFIGFYMCFSGTFTQGRANPEQVTCWYCRSQLISFSILSPLDDVFFELS